MIPGYIPEKYRNLFIPGIILVFFLLSLGLRAIPVLFTPPGGFLPTYDSDTWYTLRQVEVMVHSFPQYNWFDPMTAYPTGKIIGWGPLYPAMAAALCILLGASARIPVINTAMWLGPILGACMVPVMYLLGKALYDRRLGLVAAALSSFVSFRFFFLSSYGFVDHHVAEVLLTSLFLLAYGSVLSLLLDRPLAFSRPKTFLLPAALSLLCGFLYASGLLASTTVVILLTVTGIYTAVQIFVDSLEGRPVRDYVLLNTGTGLGAITTLIAFGIKADGFSLILYSAGQLLACAGLIGGTLVLALLSRGTRGRRGLFLVSWVLLAAAALFALLAVPVLRQIGDQILQFLSPAAAFSMGIRELNPWSPGTAWQNFNLFLLLGLGGILVLILRLRKERKRGEILLGSWAATLLFLTLRHNRFEYFLAVPFILLSALCVVETVSLGLPGGIPGILKRLEGLTSSRGREDPVPRGPGTRRRPGKIPKASGKGGGKGSDKRNWPFVTVVLVLVVLVAGSGISLWVDIQSGLQVPYTEIPGDWMESLGWVDARTPPPGMDYYGVYTDGNFTYPPGSYGVMAIWDAGHWITFFARRIPNANPFQDNLLGDTGGAAFLLAPSESKGNAILDHLGTRFVMTDIWTATEKFTSQIPWADPSMNITPYMSGFLLPGTDNPNRLELVSFYDDAYFQSMIVRLQIFDGSLTLPGPAQYIEYTVRQVPRPGETSPEEGFAAVITGIQDRDAVQASGDAAAVNANPVGGVKAVVLSDRPDRPLTKVPALSRLRLVHESPLTATWDRYSGESVPTNISYVKVFEYVRGARIRGTGTIELPLVTNAGRTFTYRQESVGGEFTVPYSTLGNPYDVKATGPYRVAGSAATFEVSEEDIRSGRSVA